MSFLDFLAGKAGALPVELRQQLSKDLDKAKGAQYKASNALRKAHSKYEAAKRAEEKANAALLKASDALIAVAKRETACANPFIKKIHGESREKSDVERKHQERTE
ncbi:hypothetical protein LCGC14_0479420 [marine sediment metagenome]|uniref:Uncharacterized protein n=1 Tax=marine sediment metagenome TaxID=412755 RepID=A0A0F9UWQ8_9ZZZZ